MGENGMITVTLSEQDVDSMYEIREMCDSLRFSDVDFNGAKIVVEPGDFTSVHDSDDANSLNSIGLFHVVKNKLAELRGE